MKKILSITIGLILIISMISALALNTSAATDAQVLRQYDRASDADILFYADFKSEAYKMNASATEKLDITISEDGRGLAVVAKPDSGSDNASYFGAYFEDLNVTKGAKVTMSFMIKSNGSADGKETPTSNSVGIGGWFIDDYMETDPEKGWNFINYYGNWNCDLPEGTLHRSGIRVANKTKLASDANNIEAATTDEEGYLTVKIEYDYDKRTVTTFYLKDGAFVEDQSSSMMTTAIVNNAKKDDHLGFAISAPHVEVDVEVKEVKIFKGLGLTPEQIAITENTTSEVEPTTTVKKTAGPVVTKAPATNPPATVTTVAEATEGGCGGSLAIAAIAMIPAIATVAVVASKKRED